jgi:hypothetical protein
MINAARFAIFLCWRERGVFHPRRGRTQHIACQESQPLDPQDSLLEIATGPIAHL